MTEKKNALGLVVYKATKQAQQTELSLLPFLEPQPTDVTDEQNHDPQAEKSTWCSVLQAGGKLSSVCRDSKHCGWTVSPPTWEHGLTRTASTNVINQSTNLQHRRVGGPQGSMVAVRDSRTREAERVLSRTSGGSLALPRSGPPTGPPELGVQMFLRCAPLCVWSSLL